MLDKNVNTNKRNEVPVEPVKGKAKCVYRFAGDTFTQILFHLMHPSMVYF